MKKGEKRNDEMKNNFEKVAPGDVLCLVIEEPKEKRVDARVITVTKNEIVCSVEKSCSGTSTYSRKDGVNIHGSAFGHLEFKEHSSTLKSEYPQN